MKGFFDMTLQHYKNVVPPENVELLVITEAPPSKDENYFYNLCLKESGHGSGRSFFRGIMQGFGLLPIGTKTYSEKKLLDVFLAKNYFVIDSCPVPLVDNNDNQLSANKKRKIMLKYTDSLLNAIKDINPDKILFVCTTNDKVLEKLKNDKYIKERLAFNTPLPYPGNGWLTRPKTRNGFIELLPAQFRLMGS